MKLGHTQGRFEMGAFSDSYVLRVLLATPTRARNIDTVARAVALAEDLSGRPVPVRAVQYAWSRPEMAEEARPLRWLLQPARPCLLHFGEPHNSEPVFIEAHGADRKMANIAFALDCAAGGSWRAPRVEIVAASRFQKRKRNPAVVAMLLRSRKPLASPPLSEVDMTPR
jgi:hypothetical protein